MIDCFLTCRAGVNVFRTSLASRIAPRSVMLEIRLLEEASMLTLLAEGSSRRSGKERRHRS